MFIRGKTLCINTTPTTNLVNFLPHSGFLQRTIVSKCHKYDYCHIPTACSPTTPPPPTTEYRLGCSYGGRRQRVQSAGTIYHSGLFWCVFIDSHYRHQQILYAMYQKRLPISIDLAHILSIAVAVTKGSYSCRSIQPVDGNCFIGVGRGFNVGSGYIDRRCRRNKKRNSLINRYGRQKYWHQLGQILLLLQ